MKCSNESIHPGIIGRNNSGNQSGKNVSFNVNESTPYNKTNRNGGNSLVYGSNYRSTSKNKENSKNPDVFRENLRKSLAQLQLEEHLKDLHSNINKDNNTIIEETKQKKNRNRGEESQH